MKHIEHRVHSVSLRHRLSKDPFYDVFAFIEDTAGMGFTGINVSAIGPGYHHLGSDVHHEHIKESCEAQGVGLEISMAGTAAEELSHMISVGESCGADTLLTFSRYEGELDELVEWTIRDLRFAAPMAADSGILIAIENRPHFTGSTLAHIMETVDHPSIGLLYDFGSSQMMGQDPLDSLEAMGPWIRRVHAKDQLMATAPDGSLALQGVTFGQGGLPIGEQTRRLFELGVDRFCFENV